MKIDNIKEKVLSSVWKPLKLFKFDYTRTDGRVEEQVRIVFDKGDGAAVLMYNKASRKVMLTKQFRMPAYINGVDDGVVMEVPAGMLDEDNPIDCIKKEILEETGYIIENVKPLYDCIMTPGAVTERVYFFVAEYSEDQKVEQGGGVLDEQEDLILLEKTIDELKVMVQNNEIDDAKTIMLVQHALLNNLF